MQEACNVRAASRIECTLEAIEATQYAPFTRIPLLFYRKSLDSRGPLRTTSVAL